MSVGALTSTGVLRQLAVMRKQLDLLHQQLGTGKKATNYKDLGVQRSVSLNARARIEAIGAFQQSIETTDLRFNVIHTTLQRLSAISDEQRGQNLDTSYSAADGAQTLIQKSARQRLDEVLSLLNQDTNGRHLFSGRATDKDATLSVTEILDGDPPLEGLKAVIEERRRADMGSDNRGRLAITSPSPGQVRLAETSAGVFGFKISAVTEYFSNATATPNSGPPPRIDFAFTGVPVNNETAQIVLNLPDGSSTTMTLKATTSATPGPGEFTIGGDAAATAANFQTALDAQLQDLAKIKLRAASALKSSSDFFNVSAAQAPQRVNIVTTPEAATSLRDGDSYGAAYAVATAQPEILGDSGNGSAIVAADSTLYSFTVDTGAGPQTVSYTSGVGATQISIVNGLLADFASNVTGAGTTIQAVANDAGTGIRIQALTADTDITIGAGAGNSGLTPASYDSTSLLDNIIAAGGAGGDILTVSVNGGAAQPITFGTGGGQVSTLAELNTELGTLTGVTASVSGTGLSFTVAGGATQPSVTVTGSSAGLRTALGLTAISGVTQYGAAPTIVWYQGDDAVDDARSTSTVRVDTSITLGYGMRATEAGFRQVVSNLAAFAAVDFNSSDTSSPAAYKELARRTREGLGDTSGQTVFSIDGEIAAAQVTMKAAKDRHISLKALFENTVADIEGIREEEVASLILDLQTRLEASYQVTANLAKLSLVNFLPIT